MHGNTSKRDKQERKKERVEKKRKQNRTEENRRKKKRKEKGRKGRTVGLHPNKELEEGVLDLNATWLALRVGRKTEREEER